LSKDLAPSQQLIINGFFSIGLFLILGKTVAFSKEIMVAWRYGVGDVVDVYTYIMGVYQWPMGLWFSVLSAVLVPMAAREMSSESGQIKKFIGELFGLNITCALVIGVAAYISLKWLIIRGWTGLNAASIEVATSMLLPLSICLAMGLIIALLSAWIMTSGSHQNTLLESVPALGLVIALSMPAGILKNPLIWGTLVGFLFQGLFLGIAISNRGLWSWPAWRLDSKLWKLFWSSIGLLTLGQAVIGLTSVVDQLYASHFGVGSLAVYGYANKITSIFSSMGALIIGRALLPVFSSIAANQKNSSALLSRHTKQWGLICFGVGMAVVIFGVASALVFVEVIFQHGAFSNQDSIEVARVYRYTLIQLPFYFLALVYFSANAAAGRYRINAFAMIFAAILKVMLNLTLAPLFGLIGLALASAGMYAFFSFYLIFNRLRNISIKGGGVDGFN
jgi:peptidoglycan biosynthesis protein MviN/MurJ (putative lipid II flippase)